MDNAYLKDCCPKADERAIIRGDRYRITVLTERMLRLEYSENGCFEDRATQTVLNRRMPLPEFRVEDKGDTLCVVTRFLSLSYDKKRFSKTGLSVSVNGDLSAYRSTWRYGEDYTDLGGTTRTLDESDGAVELQKGLVSRDGFAVFDDSRSVIMTGDGWVEPREEGGIDVYFLGYGRDYLGCIRDFFEISGKPPMLPRYALGNWWSRFFPYSEESYKQLVAEFAERKIPFSVAVLDMGWHLTDVDKKYGSGWTGFTWDRKLFPDPGRFLGWLHQNDLRITLNIHPADGVRAFEDMYETMCERLGLDSSKGDAIPFDVSDRRFLQAYFECIFHPNERLGVDFWWIDWQQNGGSRVPGLDPLWMLNHYHYLDNGRNGKRALVLSRYAGLGSHRYPVGFSGDTFATWQSLKFQPYFTSTASNAGYGWWSHDIGGHMHGVRNDEMATRWLQFGVFSPIMRLHSSDNPFNTKEPWRYTERAQSAMTAFLRLRHRMIPYTYTMNHRLSVKGEPLIQPMYYRNPEAREAYDVPNQYYFGESMIVCPITEPTDGRLLMASFEGWLPQGIYYDFFNGRAYRGGHKLRLFRGLDTIPVLVKAGSIIPLANSTERINDTGNPASITLMAYAGESGRFEMYEDDDKESSAVTLYELKWSESGPAFVIHPAQGKTEILPTLRSCAIKLCGVGASARADSGESDYDESTRTLTVQLPMIRTDKGATVTFSELGEIAVNDIEKQCFELLDKAQIEFDTKSAVFETIAGLGKTSEQRLECVRRLLAANLDRNMTDALAEIILSC